jgi:tetratricopeptide (TPR) repeat protein
MQSRRFCIIALSLMAAVAGFVSLTSPTFAQATQWGRECDRLAGLEIDLTKSLDIVGVPLEAIDSAKAIVACGEAARLDPNNAKMQFQYGRSLQASKQGQRAISAYLKAHELGSPLGTNGVGYVLESGIAGVERNPTLALAWYELAARRGLKVAMMNAALMLDRGDGLPSPNPQRAGQYWRFLADAGNQEAAEKLRLSIRDNKIFTPRPVDVPPTPSQANKGLTNDEATALGAVVVGASIACWIWSDTCKGLALEAAKGAAKETGRELIRSR